MHSVSPFAHPIVCVPHAGAGASVFRDWQARAGPSFVTVGLPGREANHSETCLHSIEAMAKYVVAIVSSRELDGVTLYGHSMGALVAYEAARWLQGRHPGRVRRLVVSGCRSPTSPSALRLSAIADDAAFMAAVADLGSLPSSAVTDANAVDYLLPILRADIGAADAYRHNAGEHLRMPLVVMGGEDDRFVPLHALAAWRDVAGASLEYVVMPGGHFFVFDHSDRVLRLLRA